MTHAIPLPNNSDFEIRKLSSFDLPTFVELGLPTCGFMYGRENISEAVMRRHFASFVAEYAFSPESEVYVVDSPEQKHVAQLWIHVTRNRFNGLKELWIWDLTVKESHRRRGIARSLLQFAKDRAKELNCLELWLLVSEDNLTAKLLYEKSGLNSSGRLMMKSMSVDTSISETKIGLVSIGRLTPSDVSKLHVLWTESGSEFRAQGRDSVGRLSKYLANYCGGWCIHQDDKMIGAVLNSFDGRKGWIERLAVHPEHRRAGIAKALVTASIQSFRERGALVIAAHIDSENSPSRRLFESIGFVKRDFLYYSLLEKPTD